MCMTSAPMFKGYIHTSKWSYIRAPMYDCRLASEYRWCKSFWGCRCANAPMRRQIGTCIWSCEYMSPFSPVFHTVETVMFHIHALSNIGPINALFFQLKLKMGKIPPFVWKELTVQCWPNLQWGRFNKTVDVLVAYIDRVRSKTYIKLK